MFGAQHHHRKKIIFGILVVLAVAGLVWFRYFKPATPPETVSVVQGTVTETISLSGGLEPSVFADLAFVGSGRITSVPVTEGASVVRGQLLMTLENPVAQAQYNESQIALKIAEEKEALARRAWDDTKKEQKEVTKLTTEQARAGTSVVSAQFVSNQVRAPFTGTITRLNARLGEVVSPGTVVARAEEKDAKQVIRVNVSESEVVKLQDGIEAEVTFDALDDKAFTAKLTSLARSSIKDQDVVSYEAIFTLLDTDQRLRDGMTADLEVIVAKEENVLTLPARAIKRDDAGYYVEVYNETTLETKQKRVEKGLEGDDGTVQVRGVGEGEKVIVRSVVTK